MKLLLKNYPKNKERVKNKMVELFEALGNTDPHTIEYRKKTITINVLLKWNYQFFPLNGAVLFPGASLPLNIFEKRYLEMIDYSLARERLIGMIQTKDNDDLYNVGCIGMIHSFK